MGQLRMNIYMKQAILQAKKAASIGETHVGAVIVHQGKVIARGYNKRETKKSVIEHAEINAIKNASKPLGGWRLPECDMYVTLEPCPMCTGAIINSRIDTVVFGAFDSKAGCMDSVINLCDYPFNHKPQLYGGIMEDECLSVLQNFFKNLRNNA